MDKSAPFTLNGLDLKKVLNDSLWFFLVPLEFYVSSILARIQEPKHLLSLTDFVPTNVTLIIIVAWVLNQILNLIRKYIV